MEPRIQYAKTSDGVNIAYWTLGQGQPLVWLSSPPWSHIQQEWQIPELRSWYERLVERRKLVRYDPRGIGLSDRDAPDFSLGARILELEAVVGRLSLDRLVLWGGGASGPVAIAYAAEHPEQVSHLILWCASAKGAAPYGSPQVRSLQALRDKDWEVYTETAAHVLLGWSEPALARRAAAFFRESVGPETENAAHDAIEKFDAEALLPQVRSPTLVLHRRANRLVDVSVAAALASRIPKAQLVVLEGESAAPFLGDTGTVLEAIDEFLGKGEEGVSRSPQPAGEHIHTMFFTDVEGSTALTERLGDAKAQELRRAHDTIVREALKGCGGSETKHTGDGIMASFPSASRAIECAVAVQRAIAERGDTTLRVRIGLNAGEPAAEEADLFGTAVNLARRICDRAEAGQILVSDVVHQLAAGKGFIFADNGEAALKGFEKPVRLFEVRWRDG